MEMKYPLYSNETGGNITPTGGRTLVPGETGYRPVDGKYLRNARGLTISQHRSAPWKTMFAAGLAGWSDLTDLEPFAQIEIKNKTGNTVSVVVNGDTDNPYVLIDGEVKVLDQDREISTLHASGSGDGNLYIYAFLGQPG